MKKFSMLHFFPTSSSLRVPSPCPLLPCLLHHYGTLILLRFHPLSPPPRNSLHNSQGELNLEKTSVTWVSQFRAKSIKIYHINQLTPVLAVTGHDKPWPSFRYWCHHFDQNWYHLYSTSAGGKDLSNDSQVRVIGPMEPEICTKLLKKLSEKLRAKFPAIAHGYPW